ncbi:CapA family protein [Kocuria sp. WN036]|uniref:CapA family protein n=1 Tax=Kocuria sp. WN036 TaxID=2032628 RepID=UPI0020D070ED|nr:CapA family protein [Kocuria sp. WN036]
MSSRRVLPPVRYGPAAGLAAVLLAGATVLAGCSPEPAGPPASAPDGTGAASSAPAAPEAAPDRLEVVVTGDVLLHPGLWAQAEADGDGELDFGPLVEGLRPFTEDAGLAVCNMETPLAAAEGPFSGYPSFEVPPQIVPALADLGYDACTTASNHAVDAGPEGLERTLDVLADAGIATTGTYRAAEDAREPLVLDADGVRVGLVTGTYGLNGNVPDAAWRVDLLDVPEMVRKARAARAAGAEIVLAAVHAGEEYSSAPDRQQFEVTHALADSGEFDFVYGHHTHSVLPIEKRGDTWIVHGLGNSVSEHATRVPVNNEGLTVSMSFAREDGEWVAGDPVWTPHILTLDPIRWCALPAEDVCRSREEDAASLARTARTVGSMGAEADGARPWRPLALGPAGE